MELFNLKFFKKASLLLAFFSCSVLFGQENLKTKVAESIFDKYHKFGLFVGGSLLFTTNESNAVYFKYKNPQGAFNIGLEYNFLQTHNFNFKAAFSYRIYGIKSTERFKKEDIGRPYDIAGTIIVGDFTQFLIPITAEYFLSLNSKLSLNFGLGPEFTIYPEDPTSGASFAGGNEDKWIGYTHIGNSKDGWLYIGINASIGLNIETRPLLLRPAFTFHYQPKDLFTNVVTTQNLMVSENTVSTHTITGNYVMFGLTIIPSRNLFGGKKQKIN